MSDNTNTNLSNEIINKTRKTILDRQFNDVNKVILKNEIRKYDYTLQKTILLIFIIFLLIAPLFFITPDFTVKRVSPKDSMDQTYEITVNNKLPTKLVSANIDQHAVEVSKTGDNTYLVEPDINGKLEIKVTLANKQYSTKSIEITGIDNESPILIDQERTDDGKLILYVKDKGLGINYKKITASTLNGKKITPESYSENEGIIVFSYPEESVNIYIPDQNNNVLHLVLTT